MNFFSFSFVFRCNLMNLLHPVILNLPMITQVNKREQGVQVRKYNFEMLFESFTGSQLGTSHVCLACPSPPWSQAPQNGRVKLVRSREGRNMELLALVIPGAGELWLALIRMK